MNDAAGLSQARSPSCRPTNHTRVPKESYQFDQVRCSHHGKLRWHLHTCIDWIVVLHPTRHKIYHSPKQTNVLQNKHKKTKPGSVTSYDIRPTKRPGLFWFRRFINLSLTYLLRHLRTYLQLQDTPGRTDWVVLQLWLSSSSITSTKINNWHQQWDKAASWSRLLQHAPTISVLRPTCSSKETTRGWTLSSVKCATSLPTASGSDEKHEQNSDRICRDITKLTFSFATDMSHKHASIGHHNPCRWMSKLWQHVEPFHSPHFPSV